MVSTPDIGKKVSVLATDPFYEFIHGREYSLIGFESGYAVIEKPSDEFPETRLEFKVPPDQLEVVQ
jgi:hypothetical protein